VTTATRILTPIMASRLAAGNFLGRKDLQRPLLPHSVSRVPEAVDIFMTRGHGHREQENKAPPGDLPADVGKNDPRPEVPRHASRSNNSFGMPEDKGRSAARVLRWDILRRHPFQISAAIIAIAIVLAGGAWWWSYAHRYESTDDAFIDTRKVQVASALNGIIVDVPVTDNQLVASDAVLVRIDPRDYQAASAQAQAQVAQAKANLNNLDAEIDAQNARIDAAREQVRQAKAATEFARAENDRAQLLLKTGSGTLQQAQQKESNMRQSEATLASAQANLTAAEKQIAVLRTQRERAAAQLEQARAVQTQAETNLSRTQVRAPARGRAASISAANGDYAVAGQALMMLVPEDVWVTANFKETQLNHMRPQQPVNIRIDAYPGQSFAGHVDSIQPGSGASFSLLPPQNATGNYVKVVQRVPVKIVFNTPPNVYVGPGMSVVPTVTVQ
jgi:membrane fusion protein, multidrug efflux system